MSKKLINGIIYSIIGLLVFAFIAIDYFLLKPHFGVNTGITYWIGQAITIFIILLTMVLTRHTEKQKQIDKNENINKYQHLLDLHYRSIVNNAKYEDLEKFVKKHNDSVKYATFLKNLDYKIQKCKNEKKKKKLIELRNTPEEEVLKMNIKYTRITSSRLYSNVLTKVNDDPNQISVREGLDLLKMLATKASFIVLGALFVVSISYDFYFSGASAIFGTLLKIILVTSAIVGAILQARKFVNGEIETTLKKRIRISLEFITNDAVLVEYLRDKNTI